MALNINPQHLQQLFQAGEWDILSREILAILEYFDQQPADALPAELEQTIGFITKLILFFFASENFRIPDALAPEFIRHNTTLAHMVRLSNFKTADIIIKAILPHKNNLTKLLTLYSPYCTVRLDLADLFSAQAYLTSLWVAAILRGRLKTTAEAEKFVTELLANPALSRFVLSDPTFPLVEETSHAYFDATYGAAGLDETLRNCINRQIQKNFKFEYKNPAADKKRVLVISAFMCRGHSVYRCIAPLIAALKPDYHVALFHVSLADHDRLDRELFDEIHTMGVDATTASFTPAMLKNILKQNYGTLLYPDIGLSRPSLILANLRLAPVQITTYGHPVTSGKTEIDYYVGGQAVESPHDPQQNFTEQLLLMPGLAVEPVKPDYTPKFAAPPHPWVEIGLSWGEMKITHTHLLRLQEIQKAAKVPVRFHFIGISNTRLTFITAQRDLVAMFGADAVKISPPLPHAEYMAAVESCDLFLDSWHFGSYNRVVDALICHKPYVTLTGEVSYTRFAATLLRQVGVPELIAETPEAFIALAARTINDTTWRQELVEKMRGINLDATLFNTGNARYFKDAMDAMTTGAVPKADKRKAPIFIPWAG